MLRPEILNDKYIPANIVGRDKKTFEMKMCMSECPGTKPIHIWLYGKSGTGKTSAVKNLLKNHKGEQNTSWLYIDCLLYDTFYSVVDKIVRELRILLSEQPNAALKLENFRNHLKGKNFIIVLDNIDWQGLRERNLTLYNLCETENIGVVCISRTKEFMTNLDERVRSRFTPLAVEFAAYSGEEIAEILKHRADDALSPDCWNESVLREIAGLADGDARVAIQIMKNAAFFAQLEKSGTITIRHAQKGWNTSRALLTENMLKSVTSHQKMLFQIIKMNPKVDSKSLRNLYSEKCTKSRVRPIKERTFHKALSRLSNLGLINKERAEGKGNIWNYNAVR